MTQQKRSALIATSVFLAGYWLDGLFPILRIIVDSSPASSMVSFSNMNFALFGHFRIVADIFYIHRITSFLLFMIHSFDVCCVPIIVHIFKTISSQYWSIGV